MTTAMSNILVREIATGIVHFGEVTIESASTESLFGAENTDIVTIGPNDVTHIPLVQCVISHAETCPVGAVDHS